MIAILMATYNGRFYVAEQIESILAQTNHDWHLFICDDLSTDGTWDVVSSYAERYPEQIEAQQNAVNSGSAGANFFGMLPLAKEADYVMFCDQDDIWLPTKVETSYLAVRRMEDKYGSDCPLLVHSDLTIADAKGEVIQKSMFAYQKLIGTNRGFSKQLVQNCVTGCTMLFNRALYRLLEHRPAFSIMHDWWIALVCAAFGNIGFVKTPLILYRQHGDNQEGAKDFTNLSKTLEKASQGELIRVSLDATYRQAEEFYNLYGDSLSEENREVLNAYRRLPGQSKLHRLKTMRKYGFWKTGWNRKAGQIVYM